jgi:hypothetical protein
MKPHEIQKIAESEFVEFIKRGFGKRGFVTRLTDNKDVRQSTGVGFKPTRVAVHLGGQPADYVLTLNGCMGYAEVKGFEDSDRLNFSRFEKAQLAGMIRQLAATGHYWVFCYNIKTEEWFVCDARWIMDESRRSLFFKEMKTGRDFTLRYGGRNDTF